MRRPPTFALDFLDRHVSELIAQTYGYSEMEALRAYLSSETYQMVLDAETGLYAMSPHAAFSLWESERVTGDPRNSVYVRGE